MIINKRILRLIVYFITLIGIVNSVFASEIVNKIKYDNKVYEYKRFPSIYINGNKIITGDMPPIITDKGRTLVPVREVFESLGADIQWDGNKRQAYILFKDRFIVLTVDSEVALVDGEEIVLDETAKQVVNLSINPDSGKVMVPLRFVLQTFDFDLIWDEKNYSVLAFDKDNTNKQPEKHDNKEQEDEQNNQQIDQTKPEQPNKDSDSEKQQYTDLSKKPVIWKADDAEISRHSEQLKESNLDSKNYPVVGVRNVQYNKSKNGNSQIVIETDGKISSVEDMIWEGKLILDIKNSEKKFSLSSISIDENPYISDIRASQYEKTPMITRIVFDLKCPTLNYYLRYSNDRKKLILELNDNYVYQIAVKQDQRGDYVSLSGLFNPTVNIFRLSNPQRIVIDMPSSKSAFKLKEALVKGKHIKGIRTSQFDENTVRVVIELTKDDLVDYKIEPLDDDQTIVRIVEPNIKNVDYETSTDKKPTLTLKKINNKQIDLSKVNIDNDYINNQCKIVFPDGKFEQTYGNGDININDENFEKINFSKDNKGNYVLNISSNHIYEYRVSQDKNNIYIKTFKPKELYDKIVVVDPGHGGIKPGKTKGPDNFTGCDEKIINLQVALKLYDLLEKNQNIKVYMTRFDDKNTTLQRRCDIANDVEADFFVSVHHNAFPPSERTPSINGTETLYIEKGTAGGLDKRLADIMRSKVVARLGLRDRGLKHREDLYVFNHTNMPSMLMELGYMTGNIDGPQLTNDDLQTRAAKGIYEGIIACFQQLGK